MRGKRSEEAVGAIRHKLLDIVVIGQCSIIGRGEGFAEMEDMGRAWEGWLRKFLELGIPDEDTFRRVFEGVDPAELLGCLQEWLWQRAMPGGGTYPSTGKR